MVDIDVKVYVDKLRQQLPYVPPVAVKKIKALHKKGDLGTLVRVIRSTMNVDVRLTVHWTSGPPPTPDAPAWIRFPKDMPHYGTPAFRDLKLDMFIMKPFAETASYGQFAVMIAHELSHVVLESIKHPLRTEEKAVDLTAMLLGFSGLYYSAAYTVHSVDFFNNPTWRRLGYLSPKELQSASRILVPTRMRALQNLRWTARSYKRLLIFWALFLGIVGSATLYDEWQLQSTVWSETATLKAQLPFQINDSVTLVDVRGGLISVTLTYRLARMPQEMSSFERNVRKNICAAEGAHIKKGISYTSEYQGPSGDPIAQIEVTSCP